MTLLWTINFASYGYFTLLQFAIIALSALQNSGIENTKIIGDKPKKEGLKCQVRVVTNILDLMVALAKLDNSDLIQTFAVTTADVHMIPKFYPEEMVSSIVANYKFSLIQNTVDRCIC